MPGRIALPVPAPEEGDKLLVAECVWRSNQVLVTHARISVPLCQAKTADQLRGSRFRWRCADPVSGIWFFGPLAGLEALRETRTLLRATEAKLRSASLTDAALGKAVDTSGSRTTTFELFRKRS